VICTTPRSGSNFLGQILASTRQLGRPLEYFNGQARRLLDHPDYPDDRNAQLAAITSLGATANGVYGVKVFPDQIDRLSGLDWTAQLPNLRFVNLERRDLLGQAISWGRAEQTQQWRSTSARQGADRYDAGLICRQMATIAEWRARWAIYFARNEIAPLQLVYEDVVSSPQSASDAVAELVGLSDYPLVDATGVSLVVQRDAVSEAWRERFLTEERDLSRLDRVGGHRWKFF